MDSFTGFYVIRGSQVSVSLRSLQNECTGTLQPSVEGLTAYRYGSTHVSIITVKNYRCNIKLVEKYLVSTEENRFEYSPVPKRCQEIRQIKIGGAIQPFFTVFWRENHKKYEIKRD